MAEEIELLEVQDFPVEEGEGKAADNAEDVVIDLSWLSSMEEKLASTCGPNSFPSFTICRVPANIRKHDHAAYNPTIVSIGPFHRGKKNLQAMEEHKWRYLHKVLAFGKGGNNLEKFLKEMKAIEMQARNCYSGNIKMSSKDFVEMLVLDGCFVIFFILRKTGVVEKDVLIYGNEWMLGLIKLDMLLLENQLPFFVLECLWELIGQRRDTLRNGALASFRVFSYKLELKSPEEDVIHHLLHLVHLSLEPDSPNGKSQITSASGSSPTPSQQSLPESEHKSPQQIPSVTELQESPRSSKKSQTPSRQSSPESEHKSPQQIPPVTELQESPKSSKKSQTPSRQSSPESEHNSPQLWDMIPTATELKEAGVRFQLLKQARSFFEVGFEQGLMVMPRLWIFDETNILFRNFIAFEQCFLEWSNHFTSYCMFIDFLVNTPRDASILREADIIRNGLGSNEDVALLFNKLGKEIVWNFNDSYLTDLFDKVNHHAQKRWPKWRAKLVRDYFGSPWAIISLIAAVIILILSSLQTYFSVFAYFKPPN